MSIGLYIVLAPLYLKSVRKLQEKRFVFVKILAIIIPENGAKVSKIKCFQFAQQTLYIENGHVTDRKSGDSASNVVLEAIKADPSTLQDQYAYLTKTNDGRLLKSSTFYIKDESGTLAYIFSINYDITALAAADQFLQSFIQTQNPAEPSASRSATPQITHNVTELLDTLIEQAISNIGKPAALMTKDEKIKVVQYLNDAGAFLITKSGDKVASILGISKFTLYNYMDAGK